MNSIVWKPPTSDAQQHPFSLPQLPRATFQLTLPPGGLFGSAHLAEGSRARSQLRSTVSSPSRALAPPPPRAPAPPPPARSMAHKEVPARPLHSPRASVRRPRLAKESAAILFFSWFQWGEKEEAGCGAVGGGPAAAVATAATTASVLVAWERRRESRARAAGGAATGGSVVGRRWRI